MTVSCPAVLVGAPASGQGKTTVAAALARLHTRAGRRVRAFKCGPDFIDCGWLELASGAPVHNLDLWMTGEDDVRARLHDAAREADLLVVEGVMGLFDGEPSAADIAARLRLPVLAVIDASAMAQTFGAIVQGLQHYRPGLAWAGVVANRVAGEGHARMLRDALGADSPWLGAIGRNDAFSLPERHLGLVVREELGDATHRLDAAATALAPTALGEVTTLARWSVSFDAPVRPAIPRLLEGRTVAVARDAAFCFVYAANLDMLRALGARLVFFSPLKDEPVPQADALWLPGGYPELHGATLAAAAATRDSVRAHVAAGRAVWAECGGMMALFDELEDMSGARHAMWQVLPGRVRMYQRLAAIGPQQLATDAGVLRGHTFHHSTCTTPLQPSGHTTSPDGARRGEALYAQGAVRASYFHAWFASNPSATAALFGAAP
jgi:cobyrinic acid a,c-diamide synthase